MKPLKNFSSKKRINPSPPNRLKINRNLRITIKTKYQNKKLFHEDQGQDLPADNQKAPPDQINIKLILKKGMMIHEDQENIDGTLPTGMNEDIEKMIEEIETIDIEIEKDHNEKK